MVSMVTWKFVVCIATAALIFAMIGYRFGKSSAERPTPAGVIDFEKREDDSIGCVFKLEGDVDWIAKQDFIIFEVRNGENAK